MPPRCSVVPYVEKWSVRVRRRWPSAVTVAPMFTQPPFHHTAALISGERVAGDLACSAGESYGEGSLLDDYPHSTSGVVTEDVEIVEIPRSARSWWSAIPGWAASW